MKFILTLVLFANLLYAKSFYINEPILDSRIFVEFHGNKNKQALLFVHGLGDEASEIWLKSINLLKNDFYIMSFDLPGFGKSKNINKKYNPKNYALIINFLVKKYFKKKYILVSHSMGSAISLKYISMFNDDVKKLVLIDAAGILYKDSYVKHLIEGGIIKFSPLKYSNETNSTKIGGYISTILSKTESLLPLSLSDLINSPLSKYAGSNAIAGISLVTENFTLIPESIKQKTLIIWGGKDKIAPLRTAYVLDKLIKDSRLVIIKNSGHVPMVSNFSEYFLHLSSFIKNKSIKIKKIKKEISKKIDFKIIDNENNIIISKNYRKLVINKSKNILLKNSIIDELIINDSDVHLFNTRIKNSFIGIKSSNSNILITNSNIKSKIAILVDNVKLDIAASSLTGKDYIIYNISKNSNSEVIFSLSKITNKKYQNKDMHKKIILKSNDKI